MSLGDAGEEIHEAAVEEGIALAQEGDVVTGLEMIGDGERGIVIDRGGRLTVGAHGDVDRQFAGVRPMTSAAMVRARLSPDPLTG